MKKVIVLLVLFSLLALPVIAQDGTDDTPQRDPSNYDNNVGVEEEDGVTYFWYKTPFSQDVYTVQDVFEGNYDAGDMLLAIVGLVWYVLWLSIGLSGLVFLFYKGAKRELIDNLSKVFYASLAIILMAVIFLA